MSKERLTRLITEMELFTNAMRNLDPESLAYEELKVVRNARGYAALEEYRSLTPGIVLEQVDA